VSVTCATYVLILVFLGLSVLDIGPMYSTDRQTDRLQTDVRQHHCLMPPIRGRGITKRQIVNFNKTHKTSFVRLIFVDIKSYAMK